MPGLTVARVKHDTIPKRYTGIKVDHTGELRAYYKGIEIVPEEPAERMPFQHNTDEIHKHPGLMTITGLRCHCDQCRPPIYSLLWNVFDHDQHGIEVKTWITGGMTLASLTEEKN